MFILLVGLNHRTAPVEFRERFSLSGEGLSAALNDMPIHSTIFNGDPALELLDIPPSLQEGVILSTCNRLEIYAVAQDIASGKATIENFLCRLQGMPLSALKPHLYFMHDGSSVNHLMRVAAGLDSMILGEPQILGQVSQAYASAQAANTAGPVLSALFEQTIHAGKRARTETEIGRHTNSISHAAARLAEEKVGDLSGARVLVVGAGEMAELAAGAFHARGVGALMCINRTLSNAENLADKLDGRAVPWGDLAEALAWADIVISATGAPHTVIHADDIAAALPGRNGRRLLCLDIAVPRDVGAEARHLPGVEYYDIDDLQTALDENMAQREAAIPYVERIIDEESGEFSSWLSSRQVVPVITQLRTWANDIAEAELELALKRMDDLDEQHRQAVEMLAQRIVNKFLHHPTIALKEQAADGNGYAYAGVIRGLFGLSDAERPPETRSGNGHGIEHRREYDSPVDLHRMSARG